MDKSPDQETTLAASEEFDNRRKTLSDVLTVLNKRERRIFETRRLAEEQIALVELAEEFGVSRERVRQIEVSAFKKVKNAVKHRVAAMATPGASAGALVSNPPPWWEKLTMDVSPWVCFTATERRERDATRRVLIEPSLDDPRTALCIIDQAPKPRAADGKLSDVS